MAYALVENRPECLPKGGGWLGHVHNLHHMQCLLQTAQGRRTDRACSHMQCNLPALPLREFSLDEGEQVWLDSSAVHLMRPHQSLRAAPAGFGWHEKHWLVPPLQSTATSHQSLCTRDSDARAG